MNYDTLASQDSIQKTIQALKEHGVEAELVATKKEALAKIKELIPAGSSVMNGSSRTLEQIGFVEYLQSGLHGWNNLHAGILAEKDPARQMEMRRQAVLSDYYLGSVHAVSETGEMVIASNTGSQLPYIVNTAPNLIFVVGAQKIMPTLPDAIKRLEEYVVPLEDKRLFAVYQAHTMMSKVLIFHRENQRMGRQVRVIFVNEKLGF
ncbi:MAG: hypothetical protein A2660_02885 [Candidatus Doudnabacteria bacterium RIFCSPHIGHO2_01_FULL_45_18]|uniref:LUD domain-containing protein n=1 Tax=Candidatus Doudnabacteria bacterium RIFCSPHIGHO2_01_FULL_45_18 TaxID=1817823 RepID=A0A1F5NR40_9BACT|nr:MAG: hypothetical protein A2660_02885 [Candidatus Doudnabacteria bacterium RIFCSPHIGHO2_01_FULL_45_18]